MRAIWLSAPNFRNKRSGMTQTLSPETIILALICYFALLLGISFLTSRNANSEDFFVAGRKAPWLLVAVGMIGASLSGVTFISIPGAVGAGGDVARFQPVGQRKA